ncbi:MAG: hypothetical protein IT565_14345, partial [Rhodospirillales bacterium]|nr:hypothetical protein [Rhodospirillales bacterium]
LREAFDDLALTHAGLAATPFDEILDAIEFYSPGIAVKLVNGETDEDVAVESPYNLFVGGNKLGRGVTIKNLLVSYYGRNPRNPQADTVLQHARMYGYRKKDIGLLRLFLPPELLSVFRAITVMEKKLRELIAEEPGEEFRGIYVDGSVRATRKAVLAPGAVGIYSAGAIYNPAQVVRSSSMAKSTEKIDRLVEGIPNKNYAAISVSTVDEILRLVSPDESASEHVWDSEAVRLSIRQLAELLEHEEVYVFVDRDRNLRENRRETAGILSGGEAQLVPQDRVTLFLLRVKSQGNETPVWWPQVRFPDGRYAFAFAL